MQAARRPAAHLLEGQAGLPPWALQNGSSLHCGAWNACLARTDPSGIIFEHTGALVLKEPAHEATLRSCRHQRSFLGKNMHKQAACY